MDQADERTNMEAILDLLEQGEMKAHDIVEKGEILRLMGRFDDAVAVLKTVPADGFSKERASKIAELALAGDTCVRPVREVF